MSCSSIDFLDVTVNLHNGFLATDLYTKPTDSNNYLHFSSDHPIHVKRAVPLNLAMRLKRICSSHADYVKHMKDLKTRLLARGYPESIINTSFRKADKTDRTQLLQNKARTVKKVDRVPMVVTFSSHLPDINMILNKKRHILHQSDRLKNIFPENSMVAYRRGRNLQDMLVHAKTKKLMRGEPAGVQNCGKECVICRRMYISSDRIHGPNQAKGHCTFDKTIGCRSTNVIYGIWCNVCDCVCYVGETGGTLYVRLSNHLSTIRTKKTSQEYPVSIHFNSADHSIDNVKIIGLERVWSTDVNYRREREKRWMGLLKTSQQDGGLNIIGS